MATRRPVKKKLTQRQDPASKTAVDKIKEVHLDVMADREYYEYGVSVIEDRAIFGSIDGLKPVLRRVLWAIHGLGLSSTSKPDKSAKGVGETLGNFHPHGDSACYDAMANAVINVPIAMIYGDGNWGTMTDKAAAMRYTNMRLSAYSDAVFFDKFYLPTMGYVPNYDGSRQEPLVLPALLPNALLNGNFGIAPGVNTRSPSFTLESVVKVILAALANNGVCTPVMCMDLVFSTPYGGTAIRTKANRPEFLEFYKKGKMRVKFRSTHTEPDAANEIRFDKFAPLDMDKVIPKVERIKGVMKTRDDSDKSDIYQTAFIVPFARTCKGVELQKAISAVVEAFSSTYTFDVKVTDRFIKPDGTGAAKLRPTTVPDLITFWLEYRKNLEIHACDYWIEKRTAQIKYLQLMRLAISKFEFLIACARDRKLSDVQVIEKVSKTLKITIEEARQIMARNLMQLRHLEDQKMADEIKSLEAERGGYEARKKKPMAYIATHVAQLLVDVSKGIEKEFKLKRNQK